MTAVRLRARRAPGQAPTAVRVARLVVHWLPVLLLTAALWVLIIAGVARLVGAVTR